MVEQYLIWVLLLGIALGAAGTWFVIGRLPRRTDDISAPELVAESEWISQTIDQRGGAAPVPLVEEVLELHVEYIGGEPFDLEPVQAPADEPVTQEAQRFDAAGSPTSPGGGEPVEPARQPEGAPRGR